MSLFGDTVETPGPEGERPGAPVPARAPTPRYPRAVVMLAALAVALVLNVIEVKVLHPNPVTTPPTTTRGRLVDDILGPRPEDIELSRVVANSMGQTQTDPAAWAHVSQVSVRAGSLVIIQVGTKSDAVVERVCEQVRRYMYSPNPYGPKLHSLTIISYRGPRVGLDDKNDACVPIREEKP